MRQCFDSGARLVAQPHPCRPASQDGILVDDLSRRVRRLRNPNAAARISLLARSPSAMKPKSLYSLSRSHRGFTFLEIMLVVAIIGILAAIVGPRLVGKTKQAKVNATKIAMNSVKNALNSYEINTGTFPSTSEGLKALLERPSSVAEEDWEKVIEKMPRDAWNEEFIYTYPSSHGMDFDLTSKGPDRQEGTADDINNWDDVEEGGA
jgi:general secretion pathway protein G